MRPRWKAIAVSAYGGFLVAQAAVKRMLPRSHGAILLTGASAAVKGYAQSAPFAMGKYALRGMAQRWRTNFIPRASTSPTSSSTAALPARDVRCRPMRRDSLLDPDAIAHSYLDVLKQPRSAWTQEIELGLGGKF